MGEFIAWLADNRQAFEAAAGRHLVLSGTALAAAIAMALPLALVLVRWHRLADFAIAAVNVLRTIPSLALLAAMLPLVGTGFLPSVIALRRKEPNAPRPYRLRAYPWIPALLLASGIAFFVAVTISDLRATAAALGAIAVSYPVRLLLGRRNAQAEMTCETS